MSALDNEHLAMVRDMMAEHGIELTPEETKLAVWRMLKAVRESLAEDGVDFSAMPDSDLFQMMHAFKRAFDLLGTMPW